MIEWFEKAIDFSNILNTSITASWLILVVIGLRFALKKAPKWVNVALWGIVALRLLMPFSIESSLSLVPSVETVSDQLLQAEPEYSHEDAQLDIITNPNYGSFVTMDLDDSMDSFQWSMVKMSLVWYAGIAAMSIYTLISFIILRRKLRTAVIFRDNLFQCETVSSPFVLGILKPKIYLPYGMDDQSLSPVIAHEQAHIRRKDHWWKPLGFLLLTIHWFNPLMWVAYILLCRDIELACDEKVIAELGSEQRADYTQALVACAVNRRMIAACPLAFGEVGVKERVKSVMNYKKPTFWIIGIALTVCLVVGICFLTNPITHNDTSEIDVVELIPGSVYVPYQCIYMNPLSSYAAMGGDSGCNYILGEDYFVTIHRDNGSIISITSNSEQEILDTGTGEKKSMTEVLDWDWKEFPYTDEEWEALFWPEGIFVVEDIREQYDNILYIRLSSELFLLNLDGSLWLVTVSNDPKVGTYIWSIYSLVPESVMGFSQWEFAPMLSSRLPVFRLEFDMDYTSIQASCNAGLLVPWDTPGSSSNTVMTFNEGSALYWSPSDEEGEAVTSAKILFTVMNGDTPVYQGNIYLDGSSGSGGRRIYTASLIGAGMHLSPNMEYEGAVISERNSPGDSEGIQLYNLTKGKLEIPIEELDNYAFITNSTKISVKIKDAQDFEGSFTLIDVSQNNGEIAWKDVNAKDKSCVFTNLTSSRIYRFEFSGLEGCTVIIR